jgi:cell division septum initiation protein DivIVA
MEERLNAILSRLEKLVKIIKDLEKENLKLKEELKNLETDGKESEKPVLIIDHGLKNDLIQQLDEYITEIDSCITDLNSKD